MIYRWKNTMIIAEISIVPLGTGTPGVSAYVKAAPCCHNR